MESLHYRHELKFLCPENSLRVMEEKIRHLCHLDSHVGMDGVYVVRSLYFDTYDDSCFREGLNGTDHRKKYRIRIYDDNPDAIYLECKYSVRDRKAKESCKVTVQQCGRLLRGAAVVGADGSQELLRRFLGERGIGLLAPKVIVEYMRTPYVYPVGNVRITFDRNIRSCPEVSRLLERDIIRRGILPEGMQLLEVKYDEVLPGAVRELLAVGRQMRRTSFSKYVLCREYGMDFNV